MVRPIDPKSKTQVAKQYMKDNPQSTPKEFKDFWYTVFPLCKNHKQYRYLGVRHAAEGSHET